MRQSAKIIQHTNRRCLWAHINFYWLYGSERCRAIEKENRHRATVYNGTVRPTSACLR